MTHRFVFVIDTEQYSGNFEREMCGYLTGQIDRDYPDSHGSKEAKIAQGELSEEVLEYFDQYIPHCLEEPDDLPIHTPQLIYPTPGWYNTGGGTHIKGDPPAGKKGYPAYQSVGIFFDERPPVHIVEILKERAQKFNDYWPSQGVLGCKVGVTGFRILEETVKVNTVEEKV